MRFSSAQNEKRRLHTILSALVSNGEFLALFSPRWGGKDGLRFHDCPFANKIAKWSVDHWNKHGKPIGRRIQERFEQWAHSADDKKLIEMVETCLDHLSEEFEQSDQPSLSELKEITEEYFGSQNQREVARECDSLNGRFDENFQDTLRRAAEFKVFADDREHFPIYSMDDVLSGPASQETYLIDNVLVRGQPGIIAGPEKCLKTMLMQDLVVSLVSEEPFLGAERCDQHGYSPIFRVNQPANVLFMSGESGLTTLRRNMQTIYHARTSRNGKSRQLSSLPAFFTLSDRVPRIDNRRHLKELRIIIEQLRIEVLILDTVSLAMPGKEASNLIVQQEMLAPATQMCQELEVTFLIVHHFHARANQYDPPTLSDIAYAGYKEWARQWILVGRRQSYEPPEHGQDRLHHLWLVTGGSAGHSTLSGITANEGSKKQPKWTVELSSAKESKKESQQRRSTGTAEVDADVLYEALLKEPMTKNMMRSVLPHRRIAPALSLLESDKRVESVVIKQGNKLSYDAYKAVTK